MALALLCFGEFMKEYAEEFYKGKEWQRVRNDYVKSVGGLCEECLRRGLVVHGQIVHHKEHITPNNINDTSVTLNPKNLILLCRECHGAQHKKYKKRYRVDESGHVSPLF